MNEGINQNPVPSNKKETATAWLKQHIEELEEELQTMNPDSEAWSNTVRKTDAEGYLAGLKADLQAVEGGDEEQIKRYSQLTF